MKRKSFVTFGILLLLASFQLIGTAQAASYVNLGAGFAAYFTFGDEEVKRSGASNFFGEALRDYSKHDYKGVIEACSRGIAAAPQIAQFYAVRAGAYTELKEFDKAIADCDKALSLVPGSNYALPYWFRGLAYAEKHNYQKALADTSSAIEADPQNPWVLQIHFLRGMVYDACKQYNEAISEYEQAAVWDEMEVNSRLGKDYYHIKQYDKAIENFSLAIKKQDDVTTSHILRGNSYIGKRDIKRAMDDFKQAQAIDASDLGAVLGMGKCYASMGQYEKALEAYTSVIDSNSGYVDTFGERASVYFILKRYSEAVADCDRALNWISFINDDGYFVEVYLIKGNSLEQLGDMGGAVQNWTRFLQYAPADHPDVQRIKEKLNR